MNIAQALAAIARGNTNMQQNAQGALPVIPNNGNPGGVHNTPPMPQQGQPPAMSQPAIPEGPPPMMAGPLPPDKQYYYPWMQPSQSMQNMRARLGMRQQLLDGDQMQPIQRYGGMILPQRR